MNINNSSFRDPSGFIYKNDQEVMRQVNNLYKENYDLLMHSGLYSKLINKGWLVQHNEIPLDKAYDKSKVYKVLKPEFISYISYPYEWSFSQYKQAALLTLQICIEALEHSMILKDATAYNIQFIGSKPIFIDTLSFEKYTEGKPWIAYSQFCKHFLSPILLMSTVDINLSKLMQVYIDGIPLDLTANILPKTKKLDLSLYLHIFLHASKGNLNAENTAEVSKINSKQLSKKALIAILNNLANIIKKCRVEKQNTEWGNYYENMLNYSDQAFTAKAELVKNYLLKCNAKIICDMGGNKGEFSKVAAEVGKYIICYDYDHTAVDRHFLALKAKKIRNILPLMLDLTNPSPDIGWANNERDSIQKRANWDCMMALALIHHMAISNNIPFSKLAEYFSKLAPYLIIEFVPKEDSQVKKLLAVREDIFEDYNEKSFEEEFSKYYNIVDKQNISGSVRNLYLLQRKI